ISSSPSSSWPGAPVSFSMRDANALSMSFPSRRLSCRIHTISEILTHSKRLKDLTSLAPVHNSCSHPQIFPRPAAGGADVRVDQVLVVQRARAPSAGVWSLPGGHIEAGETAAGAIARELMEETGITAEIGGVADCVDVIRRDDEGEVVFHRVIVVF